MAAQEISDVIEEREMKLNKALSIKANWDMQINMNRLKKEVELNPKKFYQPKKEIISFVQPVQELQQIDKENMKLEMDFNKF